MTTKQSGISVVICTYNGRSRLLPTLNSIVEQQLQPSLFELIVVDNASQDNSQEFCEQILRNSSVAFQWKIVQEQEPGLNYARLKGLREAQFDVVLFCDDDNAIAYEYLQIGFGLLEMNPQIGALGGCGVPSFEGTKPDWFDTYSHSFAVGPQSDNDGKLEEVPAELYGAGTFFRKAPLLKFFDRGFNTVMSDRKGKTLVSGGDVEWCYLVQLSGYEIWYDHRLTFIHVMPEGRMQWSYYLRLKEGIASGASLLLPYACLFSNRTMGLLSFVFMWFYSLTKITLTYLKKRLVLFFFDRPLNPEAKLGLVILRAKARSYWFNGAKTLNHFNQLRRML